MARAILFHVKPVRDVARYLDLDLDPGQLDRLRIFRDWLKTEAIPAGGLGPAETPRLESRHLADSLLFAVGLPEYAETVWDLGTGVGLPGIPLAICLPNIEFVLIDRSGRRVGLLGRLVRILDLDNCEVRQGEIDKLAGSCDAIVARASLPPARLRMVAPGLLRPGGVAVVGGSWLRRPEYPGWEVVEIPAMVLDQTVWLLIMRSA